SILQGNPRRPVQDRAQFRVVGIASAHALRPGYVLAGDLDSRDVRYNFGEFVYRNHPVLTHIERVVVVRSHQLADPGETVVDIAERARLLAVAPDLDFVI